MATQDQKAQPAAKAVWEAVKRTPGLIAGGPVDVANLALGLLSGKGLEGLSAKPVGGGEWINEFFGLKQNKDALQQGTEAALSMLSPGGVAKGAALGGASLLGMLKILNAGGAKPAGKSAEQLGAILMHGGAKPITAPDPNLVPNIDYQAVFGPGFYTTDDLRTPFNSAMKNSVNRKGVVSVFDFPDEQYASTLKMSLEPISKQPEVEAALAKLVKDNPEIGTSILELAKFRRQGTGKTIDQTVTGELVEKVLRDVYGRAGTYQKLAEYGIPGRTWQYSAGSPEVATIVFREAYPMLKPIGSFEVTPGSEGFKIAEQELQKLLSQQPNIGGVAP